MKQRPPELIASLPETASTARVIVAFSGGLDSTVLLHALAQRDRSRLAAVHVHHGLQPAADDWARRCEEFCASLEVPLTIVHASIPPNDQAGPEAAARNARYALLHQALLPGDVLATAHHRDDQAETVMLRLLRGSGIHGLASMRPWSEFTPGWLWRPLLDRPRTVLERYAGHHRLTGILDPHNTDFRYARSYLRAQVMPKLRARWPQANASLARAARLAADTAELVDSLAQQDLVTCACELEALSVSRLLTLSRARRHNLLRFWLRGREFEVPFASMLDRIDVEMLEASAEAMPLLRWPGCELRRYRDTIHAMTPLSAAPRPDAILEWASESSLQLPSGCGTLVAGTLPARTLNVRWMHIGETFARGRIGERTNSRSFKNLFQEAGVPPWLRSRVPVLELDGRAACIAGIATTPEWREMLACTGWQPFWKHEFRGMKSPIAL